MARWYFATEARRRRWRFEVIEGVFYAWEGPAWGLARVWVTTDPQEYHRWCDRAVRFEVAGLAFVESLR